MTARDGLQQIIAGNRAGQRRGVGSWCTAHPQTLRAVLEAHRDDDDPILIEATCNQVNQHGGYTGMTPASFRRLVESLATEAGVDARRIIFGGDHLGPNPWKDRPAGEAMRQACDMVKSYAEAGFTKIHLDASMSCADDGALPEHTIAERAAELCAVAEMTGAKETLAYVIGTEVPVPGGETHSLDNLAVTRPESALRTFDLHRAAFEGRGIGGAMARVIAIVVQPGVDFGNAQVFPFDKTKAAALSKAVTGMSGVVYEAHSTDFQTEASLAGLVGSHFAILKVGPELTYAFREAIVAMAAIEDRLFGSGRSDIISVLERVMDGNIVHWRDYVEKTGNERIDRLYGFSDRVRYYWSDPRVSDALKTLMANIDLRPIHPGLATQFAGEITQESLCIRLSQRIIFSKVGAVVAKYRRACAQVAV
jgi:D-tagatose-bisphosphate aldolase class II non-catalytic subunit